MTDPRARAGDRPASPGTNRGNLAQAMSGIWEKFRDVTLDRVATLEEATLALLGGELGPELRERAEREAHKLAGAVGTFGFARGSEIAREIELLLGGTAPLDQAQTLHLSEMTVALRRELEQTQGGGTVEAGDSSLLLLIDDDREFVERVVMEAEGRGMATRVAARMSDAHALLAAESPDVVLLDPTFAGSTEAGMRLLAEMTTRAPSRPILVASKSAEFTDRVEAARLGSHAYLQKPISPSQAVDAVQQAMSRREVCGRIIAVDDDSSVLDLLRAVLQPRGLEVTTVEDPLGFWSALESVRPDLVILDVDMPNVNGIELCRVIRNDSRWSTTPVIFLTARTDAETIQQVFAAGADDYVPKPIVGPELTIRIENRLERVRLYHMVADTDALTGASNRRKSEETITRLITLAGRQKQPFALALIDLDHFKRINDRFGHAVGDDVLRRAAKRLRYAMRGEDVIGRWGGEEFVIGAYGVEKKALERRLAEVLDTLRSEPVMAGTELLPLTFSAGVAEFPTDGSDLGTLYRVADATLYEAKAQGRDRVLRTGWARADQAGPQDVDVLLVEDDPVLAELLLHALTTHGYSTRWLRDGESSVESLAGETPAFRARVILLDVNLPGRDGLGVLQELSRSGVTEKTRVIMLTVRSAETEVVRSLELGAFDHVAKPFSVPVLLRRIHTALQKV